MPLSLRQPESVRDGIKRILDRRIRYALELINAGPGSNSDERIHEARKQLNHVRTLLQLIRPDIGRKRCMRADRRLRQMTRALSGIRDTTVLLESLQEMRQQGHLSSASLARLRAAVKVRRKRMYAYNLTAARHQEHMSEALRKARKQIAGWSSIHKGWKAIGPGLRRVHEAARKAAAVVRAGVCDDETLHEVRKRSKNLLHALEFLRRTNPGDMRDRIRILHHLTDLLGKDHDLAVLEDTVGGRLRVKLEAAELRRLLTAISKRRRSLQRRAFAVSRSVYAVSDDVFVKRIHRYWRQWRAT